ncbi:MAG: nuclease-related domain-containing protein [Nocardioidaceae bacterium]
MFERTSHGQAYTSRALARLGDDGWVHLDDVAFPGRPRDLIDHIAVGPGCIAVIATVNWIGDVDIVGGRVLHNGRPSGSVEAVQAACGAVRRVLPPDLRPYVVAFISLVRDASMERAASGLLVCSTASIADALANRPPLLSERDVTQAAAVLWAELVAPHSDGGRVGGTAPVPTPAKARRSARRRSSTGNWLRRDAPAPE